MPKMDANDIEDAKDIEASELRRHKSTWERTPCLQRLALNHQQNVSAIINPYSALRYNVCCAEYIRASHVSYTYDKIWCWPVWQRFEWCYNALRYTHWPHVHHSVLYNEVPNTSTAPCADKYIGRIIYTAPCAEKQQHHQKLLWQVFRWANTQQD